MMCWTVFSLRSNLEMRVVAPNSRNAELDALFGLDWGRANTGLAPTKTLGTPFRTRFSRNKGAPPQTVLSST
jgi:hypothetical protein